MQAMGSMSPASPVAVKWASFVTPSMSEVERIPSL
ncbi:hypothetical protein EVA_15386 [gut metagenome]|uniref:Uncharacterized protein n=1 Tax=gut metagenome TaxID=749906 RepID=J9G3V2_9ZZZZ